MAAVNVTLDGMLYDLLNKSSQRVVFIGDASLTGLSVGGGPVYPSLPPVMPGPPGFPTFPIWGPPGIELPPRPGYPPVAGHPLPPVPDLPPGFPNPPPEGSKPPPQSGWGWAYDPNTGWYLCWVPPQGGGKPQPPLK
jgi:hypothetical protein